MHAMSGIIRLSQLPRLVLGAIGVLWALAGCAADGGMSAEPPGASAQAQAMAEVQAPLLNTYWKLRQMGDGSHVSAFDNQPATTSVACSARMVRPSPLTSAKPPLTSKRVTAAPL